MTADSTWDRRWPEGLVCRSCGTLGGCVDDCEALAHSELYLKNIEQLVKGLKQGNDRISFVTSIQKDHSDCGMEIGQRETDWR